MHSLCCRLSRDFLPEYYELHRRDAVSMERLSSSPYVMDVFGYCGQSAVTELAFSENGMNNLYRLSTGKISLLSICSYFICNEIFDKGMAQTN